MGVRPYLERTARPLSAARAARASARLPATAPAPRRRSPSARSASSSATSAPARSTRSRRSSTRATRTRSRRRRDSVYGVVSLIFWSVTIVVTRQVRAAGDARRQRRRGRDHGPDHADPPAAELPGGRRTKLVLAALGVFGASLFFGDSMITPAISVLSAVEGLKVVEPSLGQPGRPDHRGDHRRPLRDPALRHRRGRAPVRAGHARLVRRRSAPAGSRGIADAPARSSRRSRRATRSTSSSATSATAFFSLAAVVLAITGAEALYADMGHFGRAADHRAPGCCSSSRRCILSYLGQGALILDDPAPTSAARSSCWSRTGAGCRWSSSRPRDGDRLAGGDHRRLLGRPPGGPARLPAAPARRPHLRARRCGQIYVPLDQLAADGRRCWRWSSPSRPRPRSPSPTGWR